MNKLYYLTLICCFIFSNCKKSQVNENELIPVKFEPIFNINWQLHSYSTEPYNSKYDSLGKIIFKLTKENNQFESSKICYPEEVGCDINSYSIFPLKGNWIIKKGILIINSTIDNKTFAYKIEDITKDSLKLSEVPYDYLKFNSFVFKPVYP